VSAMDKKDLYEHLAKIYLDASSRGKKQPQRQLSALRNLGLFLLAAVLTAALFSLNLSSSSRLKNSQLALVIQPETVKINFNFDPAKKEIYSLNLNRINLSRFRALSFSVKKSNYQDRINLKIELASKFREKSDIYIKDIPSKWQNFKINLADFKTITALAYVSTLSFIVEEWNTREKNGVVYIDNISLLK
jgi:hypothetical protein